MRPLWGKIDMYAFVHIEKTAGTTLTSILRRSYGARHCDVRLPVAKRHRGKGRTDQHELIDVDDLRRVRRIYRNLSGIAGHHVKAFSNLELECAEIRYFAFLRDPAKRYRSHFLTRAPSHDAADFDAWVSASWTHNWQTKMIAGQACAQKAIDMLAARFGFIGLTERFDESLLMMGQWIGEPGFKPEYRSLNQHYDNRGFRDAVQREGQRDIGYLDSASARERIAAANVEDRKVYEFVLANIYPRQCANYRGELEVEVREFQARNLGIRLQAESRWSGFLRNYIYKPAIHLRAA
ncbi:MAG TPA: sulfotransferase family 2 domain-containing protein [Pirellulales bacterium]